MERIDNESGFVQVYFCNTADAATSRPHKTLAQEPEQPSSAYTHSRLIPGDSKVAGPRTCVSPLSIFSSLTPHPPMKKGIALICADNFMHPLGSYMSEKHFQ
mmetsp:Transcript_24086/g.65947  ORF Transcript_24086/g.65947 Transcript_24086/m.65947 type:complete len:102 (-) Transcript_24086:189-494(-)